MVCPRCIMAVQDILIEHGIPYVEVKLGEILLKEFKDNLDLEALKQSLEELGFELIEDQQVQIVERIKLIIIDIVRNPENYHPTYNLSYILSDKLGRNYHYLSYLFSSKEGITIEKYMILQKIEFVKELLIYDELNLSEIAYKLHYSSIAHLSNQFKQVTGFSPTAFKKLQRQYRNPLDRL